MNNYKKLVLVFAALVLSGCFSDKLSLVDYVAKVKSEQKVDIEPIQIMKSNEEFVYAASDLRDPFVTTETKVVTEEQKKQIVDEGIQPDLYRRKEALEAYTLSELQFVGTLGQESTWALIRDSDGIINRVEVGNYMGTNHGQVMAISEAEIVLKEIVPDGNGLYVERDLALSIAEPN